MTDAITQRLAEITAEMGWLRAEGYLSIPDDVDWLLALVERQRKALEAAQDALIWCSGGQEFGVGGASRDGWVRVAMPAMKSVKSALGETE